MSNFLPLGVRAILAKTGWTENEIAIYSTLLSKGAMNLTTLAQETSNGVSTVQYALKQLIIKKMVQKTLFNDKPLYSVTEIDCLRKWLKGYLKQFLSYEDTVNQFIEQYDFNPQVFHTKVRLYEGKKGVKKSYQDLLDQCNKGDEIYAFFSVVEEIEPEIQDYFEKKYIPDRVKKGIKIKNLAIESPTSIAYKIHAKEQLSQTQIVSRDYFPALNTEVNLIGDSMHCMSFTAGSAFAYIVEDPQMVAMLKAIFELLWSESSFVYMTENTEELADTIKNRKDLYETGFKDKFRNAKPEYKTTKDNETVLYILDHEVMNGYELPYMQTLGEIVTRNGGNILNVGYGLGFIDEEIEKYRKERNIEKHVVIEFNEHIANEAKKIPELEVWQGEWKEEIKKVRGLQFDGIIYDAYPLSLSEVHRDGVLFIEKVVERNLLKENGILTFYVDATETLGSAFLEFLDNLGLAVEETIKVPIEVPKRNRQSWSADHFIAPVVQYKK